MKESIIWVFFFGILSVYPFFPLRHVPVLDRLKIPFRRLMLYASIIMLVQGISYLWLSTLGPFGAPVLAWHRKLFMIPYVLLTLCFSKDSKGKTLFMDFFMVGIVMAVIDFAYIVDRSLFAEAFATNPHRTDVLVRGVITLLIYPPLYHLFKIRLRPIMHISSVTVWWHLTTIPFVFAVISIITTMEAFGHEVSLIIIALRFSIIGGSVLVCVMLDKVIVQLEQTVLAQEKSKQAERLLALQNAQYSALTQNIEQMRETRHNLRHQLAAIATMTRNGEYDRLLDFVESYRKSVPADKDLIFCENYAANSIISHYSAFAKSEESVEVDAKCTLGNDSGVEDIDLCVLLGNLLENAIDGCKRIPEGQRKIKLRIATHAGQLMIAMDNTFDDIILKEDGKYISRKRSGRQKGVGLISVEAIVGKYDGDLQFREKEGWFMVSVILPEVKSI